MPRGRTLACPACSRPPAELTGKLRDSGEPWASVFCRWCWRPGIVPERELLVGTGATLLVARREWNRLIQARAARPSNTVPS